MYKKHGHGYQTKENQESIFSEKSQVFEQGTVTQCGARFSDANYPKSMKDF